MENHTSQPGDSSKSAKPMPTFVLYQFKDVGSERRSELKLIRHQVTREVYNGYWIKRTDRSKDTWISKTASKRIAWPTMEEAYKDWKERKQKKIDYHEGLIAIHSRQMKQAATFYVQQKEIAEVRDT